MAGGKLAGKVAFVTGGSRGIGLATARAFGREGASIAIVSRTREEVSEAERLFRKEGVRVIAVCGDVADRAISFDAVRYVENTLGPIDVLVNNAAVQGPIGPIEELDPDDWRYTLEVGLLAPVWLLQAVIPPMKARARGSIINLSGGGATSPRERFTAYAAAKTALVRVTETVAQELAPFCIRVNAVAPGAINTRMLDEVEAAGERAGDKALADAKRQRETGGGDLERVADLMVFLASDESKHVSGRLISAVWDDWESLRDRTLDGTDWFTLRRVTPPSADW
jgi:3-oxoacyl-[acyl-carrier protein] reductase